jgi:streptogramin lyase
MKINKWSVLGLVAITSLVSAYAGSKYSGIYDVRAGGNRVLVSVTGGGHVLSLSNDTDIKSELNPAVSTVNASGKFIGSSASGLSVVGKIDSDFKLTGTAKVGKQTIRLTGSRTLN